MNLAELSKELPKHLISCFWRYILDDQIHLLHALLELISLLLELFLSGFLVLELGDIDAAGVLCASLLEVCQGLLSVLPLVEADKPKAFGGTLVVSLDNHAGDPSVLCEERLQVCLREVTVSLGGEVLDVKVRTAFWQHHTVLLLQEFTDDELFLLIGRSRRPISELAVRETIGLSDSL